MADAHALVSFMQSGAIAQGDLVLTPAALLPVGWRSSRGIEGRVRLVGTVMDVTREAAGVRVRLKVNVSSCRCVARHPCMPAALCAAGSCPSARV